MQAGQLYYSGIIDTKKRNGSKTNQLLVAKAQQINVISQDDLSPKPKLYDIKESHEVYVEYNNGKIELFGKEPPDHISNQIINNPVLLKHFQDVKKLRDESIQKKISSFAKNQEAQSKDPIKPGNLPGKKQEQKLGRE